MLSEPVQPQVPDYQGGGLPPASMPVLSPSTQEMYETMDIDGQFYEWQIPNIHKMAFRELIDKGYLVRDSHQVISADGQRSGQTPSYWVFNNAIRSQRDETMLR